MFSYQSQECFLKTMEKTKTSVKQMHLILLQRNSKRFRFIIFEFSGKILEEAVDVLLENAFNRD